MPAVVGRFSLVFLLLVGSVAANARGYSAGTTAAGATFGIKFASNGTPMATIGGVTGAVVVSQAVPVVLPGVVATLPVLASAAMTGASVAGAWGAAAAVLGTAALYALPSIKEYMDSRGLGVGVDGLPIQRDPSACTVAPCYEYSSNPRYAALANPTIGPWSNSQASACQAAVAMHVAYTKDSRWTGAVVNGRCQFYNQDGAISSTGIASRTSQPVSSTSGTSISNSEAVTLLTAASPTIAAVQALVDLNFPPPVERPTLSGPATQFKGNVVSLGLDGTVKSIEERYNLKYNTSNFGTEGGMSWNTSGMETVTPPVVTTAVTVAPPVALANGNTSTTTTTTKTATPVIPAGSGLVAQPVVTTTSETVEKTPQGVVVSSTTSATSSPGSITTPETAPTEEEEKTDYCKDHPEILGCATGDIPDGEIPKESRTITYTEESVFGAGSCPANLSASIGTLGKTVTVWDWQKTCEMALPLRALVLALASFAAFLIVMPGDNRT